MSYYCAHCKSRHGHTARWKGVVMFLCRVCGKTTKFLVDDEITVDIRSRGQPGKYRKFPKLPDLL